MRPRASLLALLLAASAIAQDPPAPAAPAAKPPAAKGDVRVRGPVKITAERADLEQREVALYRGNVKLTSAELELSGDRLELRQPAKGQFQATLTGKPARLKHKAVGQAPPVDASAGQIDYDSRSGIIQMSGGAQLERTGDVVTSDSIRYNVAARRISATGARGAPVQILIQPPPGVDEQKGQNTPQQ